MTQRLPPDHAQRSAAIEERGRNLLVDAGAGTGKTTLLVSRFVGMVAPPHGGRGVPIHRLAAITFTRKAAGELRLRVRERLLARLTEAAVGSEDERNLRDALAGLDTAYVGTIHGFSDRLLRLHPARALLSPAYAVTDDEEPLIQETYELLLGAAQSGTLAAELWGYPSAPRAAEAAETLLTALATGLPAETKVQVWGVQLGLDALIAGFLRQRDVEPADRPAASVDLGEVRSAIDRFIELAAASHGDSECARWVADRAEDLRKLIQEEDPEVLRAELHFLRKLPKMWSAQSEKEAWIAYRDWRDELHRAAIAPLDRWMATRLVRLFPVARDLYDRVRQRRQKLDQLDLLARLRDLLRDDRDVRRHCQGLFDHIFVDEFQDTDPLQAEIILFLSERDAKARCWDEVELQPGKLTLVGDPKQSIYRFRRADVAMYDQVRELVRRGGALEIELSASFRSVPSLVDWLNDRFAVVLGVSDEGCRFDVATGRVFFQKLVAYRRAEPDPAVHVLPVVLGRDAKKSDPAYRSLEARAVSRYLRWLIEDSGFSIEDKASGRRRCLRHGDIAILALTTTSLAPLFPELDREGIPYASRGGRLFLSDPLIRRLALALRAVSDPQDGVAEATLLSPPFFSLTPADLLRERVAFQRGLEPDEEGARMARRAREWLAGLRRQRHSRPIGAVARDLLEETALGRVLAAGSNGRQRLARARELCMRLEAKALADGLDLDAATAVLRRWAEDPVEMDPPHPVGAQALQILTVHQAKGLEFPVVVMWDGRAKWERPPERPAWRMARDGSGWIMEIAGLECEEPILQRRGIEAAYQETERRRVAYVAATRARDLLVLPRAGVPEPKLLFSDFHQGAPPELVREMAPFAADEEPEWSSALASRGDYREPAPVELAGVTARRWADAIGEARVSRFRPVSVTEGHDTTPEDEGPREARPSRRGKSFGTTVHLAMEFALRGAPVEEAVRRAARRGGWVERPNEVEGDVHRALAALRSIGLPSDGTTLAVEYPLAGRGEDGTLVSGRADLVAVDRERVVAIDFKTDTPPEGRVEEAMPEYAAQVRAYGRLLRQGGVVGDRRIELGVLFTADGEIDWIEPVRKDAAR